MSFEQGLSAKDIDVNNEFYRQVEQKNDPYDGWLSAEIQQTNFDHLVKIAEMSAVPLSGSSVLDVGCGRGALYAYLQRFRIGRYVGVDINPLGLAHARTRYPNVRFEERDLLARPLHDRFDYSFCSGTFSTKLFEGDNYEFVQSMLGRIWEVTDQGLAFNFTPVVEGMQENRDESALFLYQSREMRRICRSLPGMDYMSSFTYPISHPETSIKFQSVVYVWR